MNGCEHLREIKKVTPSADGCEDCLKIGDSWVHLRLCEIVRSRRLLRQFAEQTRDETFSRDQSLRLSNLLKKAKNGVIATLTTCFTKRFRRFKKNRHK